MRASCTGSFDDDANERCRSSRVPKASVGIGGADEVSTRTCHQSKGVSKDFVKRRVRLDQETDIPASPFVLYFVRHSLTAKLRLRWTRPARQARPLIVSL